MTVFRKRTLLILVALLTILPFFYFSKIQDLRAENSCGITREIFDKILSDVIKTNGKSVESLDSCLKSDSLLMFHSVIRSLPALLYVDKNLRNNEDFILRLLKIDPRALQYAADEIKSNQTFMTRAIYLDRNSLQYANQEILDNKLFIKKMIDLDSRNYMFASYRLRNMEDIASKALNGDGLLMEYASDEIKNNRKMAIIAIKSNKNAFNYVSNKLKLELVRDKKLKKIFGRKATFLDKDKLTEHLQKNYFVKDEDGNIKIENKALFFAENKLIDRQYVKKWQRFLALENYRLVRSYQIIAADNRNYPNSWKDDLAEYPKLIDKIEGFLQKRQVDQNTIDSLSLQHKWLASEKPKTVAFKLYLLREGRDAGLDSEFNDITSLTVIAYESNGLWDLSVVEVLFGKEIKMDISYKNGHKQYELWDLYKDDKNDKDVKLIYKIEDRFGEYFEVYGRDDNNKYKSIFQLTGEDVF